MAVPLLRCDGGMPIHGVTMIRRLVGALLGGAMIMGTGCSAYDAPASPPTASHVLTRFYESLFRDRDAARACELTTPRFRLRATGLRGRNIARGRVSHLGSPPPVPDSCLEALKYVIRKRGDSRPFTAWRIEELTVSADGKTARAVTSDGSAGLEMTSSGWRVAWLNE